jgi:hypothetical protein
MADVEIKKQCDEEELGVSCAIGREGSAYGRLSQQFPSITTRMSTMHINTMTTLFETPGDAEYSAVTFYGIVQSVAPLEKPIKQGQMRLRQSGTIWAR